MSQVASKAKHVSGGAGDSVDGGMMRTGIVASSASHQTRSWIPGNSSLDISSTVPPVPKYALPFFLKHPFVGQSLACTWIPGFIRRHCASVRQGAMDVSPRKDLDSTVALRRQSANRGSGEGILLAICGIMLLFSSLCAESDDAMGISAF